MADTQDDDDEGLSQFVLKLPEGYAAIIIDEEGSLVEAIVGGGDDDSVMTRGQTIAMMLHDLPEEKLNKLIQEFLMTNTSEGDG